MPTIVQTVTGKVTGLWGTAKIRGANGQMQDLHIGDTVNRGDVILTSQNGIVQLTPDETPVAKALPPVADIDRVIADIERPIPEQPTAAGLAGGDGGLQPGLRVDRVAEAVTPASLDSTPIDRGAAALPDNTARQLPSNQPPVADGASLSVNENTPLTVPLTGRDSDGTVRAITVTTLPDHGTLALADGTPVAAGQVLTPEQAALVKFTPEANYSGPTGIVFTVTDNDGATSTPATVSIQVQPVNEVPVAVNDAAGTPENTPISIAPSALLANDSDPDGNPLTLVSVQNPLHGTVALVNGNVVFTPEANYVGPASFTYTVSDGQGGSSTATVDVGVAPSPVVPPTITSVVPGTGTGAGNDSVPEGTPLVYTVTLSAPSTTPTSFDFKLATGTTPGVASDSDIGTPSFSNGVTFDPTTGKVTVPAGVGSFTTTVPTLVDGVYEGPETLPLTVGGATGTGTITDTPPTITSVVPGTVTGAGDDSVPEGTPLVYTVTLSTPSTTPTSFDIKLGGGSATVDADYGSPTFSSGVTFDPTTGKITVPAGITSFTTTVPTIVDGVYEGPETVPLTVGGATGTGTITDAPPTITSVVPGTAIGGDAVSEGTPLVYTVTLSTPSTAPTSFDFKLATGTAPGVASDNDIGAPTFSNGVTFDATTGQVTVPAGVTSFTTTVPTIVDGVFEGPETLPLTVGGATGIGTITDVPPTVTSVVPGTGVGNDNVPEGTPLVYEVKLSTTSTTPVSFDFKLGGGTASADDYGTPTFSNGVTFDPSTGKVTVPAGVGNFTTTVPTLVDGVYEGAETLPLTVGGATGTGTITDTPPTISSVVPGTGVGDDTVLEGTPLVYTVTLSTPSTTPTSFDFKLATGTAPGVASDSDIGTPTFSNGVTFDPSTGKVTVPAGVASFTTTVPTVADGVYEGPETVPLTVGGATGTGTITDVPPTIASVVPGTGVGDDAVPEGTPLVYTVTLSTPSTTASSFDFKLVTGTGPGVASDSDIGAPSFSNGVTFDPTTGKITVPAGVTSFTTTVPTVVDGVFEGPETLPLTVGGATGIGTITDVPPTITSVVPGTGVGDDTVPEGTPLVYTVTLSTPSTTASSFDFKLGGGTATAGADYSTPTFSNGVSFDPTTGKITVPAGVTSFTTTVPTVVDGIYEGAETLPLTVGGATGTGTITDTPPTITSVVPGTAIGGDTVSEGTPLVYTVTLSTPSITPTSFDFKLATGTAPGTASDSDIGTPVFSNGVTFDPTTGQVSVPAGVASFTTTVPTIVDGVFEGPETLPLTVGGATGIGTITDVPPTITSVVPGTGVGDDAVPEGTPLVYEVKLSTTSATPTSFDFKLGGGTTPGSASSNDYGTPSFSNGVTYDPSTGKVTVPAGVGNFTTTVPTIVDGVFEGPESLPLAVGGATGTGTITDTPPTIKTVEPGAPGVGDDAVPEGTPLVYTVTLSVPSTTPSSFDFKLGGGTATAGADYGNPTFSNGVTFDPVTGKITVPAGVTSFTTTVPTIVDGIYEGPETVPLTVGGATGTGTIADTPPTIKTVEPGAPGVGDDAVPEGTPLVYTVTLSVPSTTPTSFDFKLGGGTATAGADYGNPTFSNGVTFDVATGKITVPANVTSFTTTVPTIVDGVYEGPETVPLTIGGATGTGVITDTPPTIKTVEPGGPGVGDDAVPEGTPLVYTVTLSVPSTTPTSFDFKLGGGTATAGADYGSPTFSNGVTFDPATGKIIVPAGVTSFTTTVPTIVDGVYEGNETVPLTVGGATGTGIITDTPPTIKTVEPGAPGVGDDAVPEGTPLVYTVTLSVPSTTPTSFDFKLGGGTATAGADYGSPTFSNGVTFDPATGKITVPANVVSFTTTVPTIVDGIYEGPETVPLTVGGATGTGTITDTPPTIKTVEPGAPGVGDDAVPEGTPLVYTVTLSVPSTTPTSFDFKLGGGTATAGADYGNPTFSNGVTFDAATGKITVPANVVSFTTTVPTIIDGIYEGPETVPLTAGGATGTGTITDTPPTIKTVEPGAPGVGDDAVPEGTPLVYTVTLSVPSTTSTSFDLKLGGGTATAGADYGSPTFSNGVTFDAATGKITVPANVTSFTTTVPTIVDGVYEGPETVPLTIGGATGTGVITDTPPTIKTVEPGGPGVGDDAVPEGTPLVYTVTLSVPSTTPSSFDFKLGGGTATAGADYGSPTFSNGVTFDPASGKITVPANVVSFTTTVPTIVDGIYEGPETVPLTVGGATGTGTITDTPPTIKTVEPGAPGVGDDAVPEGTPLVYTVTLSVPSTTPTSFDFKLGGGTATAGADYGNPTFSNGVTFDPATGKITVPANVVSFSTTVPTIVDGIYEGPETVPLTVGGATGTGIITDTPPTIKTVEPGGPGVGDDAVPEGTPLVYTVTLSVPSTTPTSFDFKLGGGTATAGADYGNPTFSNGVTFDTVTGKITVPANVTSFTTTVPTIVDGVYEGPETVPLTIGGATGTGIITDTPPTIKTVEPGAPGVGDDAVPEGTPLVYTVTLSVPSTTPTNFDFKLGGGTATAGADYGNPTFSNGVTFDPVTGKITVPANVTSFTTTVPTIVDGIYEGPETVPLTVGGATGTGIITDTPPTIKTVEPGGPGVGDDSVPEGTPLVYTVTLSVPSTTPTSFDFKLGGGTATAGADYGNPTFSNGVTFDPVTGKITVPANVTSFTTTVPTIVDGVYEGNETVPLTVGGATGTGIITDTPPTIKTVEPGGPGVGDDAVPEGTPLVYTVTLSVPSTTPTSFDFKLGGGTATAGADYGNPTFSNGVTFDPATGKITVPANVVSFTTTVPTIVDGVYEGPETVPLTIGGATGTGTITDTPPTIKTVEPGVPGVGDDAVPEGTPLVYTVTLSVPSTTPTSFDFKLGGGTATAGADYGNPTFSNGVTFDTVTGKITVPANVVSFTTTVPTIVDGVYEGPETVPLTIGGATGTGVITDTPPTIKTVEPGGPGVGDDAVPEGTPLVYTVTLSVPSTTPTSFDFKLGGGTATAGSDYGNPTFSNGVTFDTVTGKITVPAGVTSFTTTVPTIVDGVYEGNETVPLTVGGATGTGIITDTPPTIVSVVPGDGTAVGGATVLEGTPLVYTIKLSVPSTTASSFDFKLVTGNTAGSASANDIGTPTFSNGVTYDPVTGKISVPAGVTSFTTTVPTLVDGVYEGPETLPLTVGGVTGIGTIYDIPPAPKAVDDLTTVSDAKLTATGNVITNDTDFVPGDRLAVQSFQIGTATYAAGQTATLKNAAGITEGQLTLNTDGSFSVTRAAGYLGAIEQVKYTVVDSAGKTAAATLSIANLNLGQQVKSYEVSTNLEEVNLGNTTYTNVAATALNGGVWRTDDNNALHGKGTVEVGTAATYGVSGSSTNHVLEMEQDIGDRGNLYTTMPTVAGEVYALNFDYAARQTNNASANSVVNVYWEGQLVQTLTQTSGTLTHYTLNLVASQTGTGKLEFVAQDSNSYGGVFDNLDLALLQNTGVQGYRVNLPGLTPTLFDPSGTETLLTSISGIPTGWTLVDDQNHTVTAGASGTVSVTGFDFSALSLLPSNSTQSSVALTVISSAVDSAGNVLASTSEQVNLALTGSDAGHVYGGFTGDTLTGSAAGNQTLWGLDGNDTIKATAGNNTLLGGTGNDTLTGGSGRDTLDGGAGDDTLRAGTGRDVLSGGQGNDTMYGSTAPGAVDTFKWHLGDAGTTAAPAKDTIYNFSTAQGDILDLRDLLTSGATAGGGATPGNATNYLHFTNDGKDTTIHVSTSGGFSGGFNAAQENETIVLKDVLLPGGTDQTVINNLLQKNSLILNG